jgi:hypothetical protein
MGSGCFELDRNVITHFPRIRILVPGYLPGGAEGQQIKGDLYVAPPFWHLSRRSGRIPA